MRYISTRGAAPALDFKAVTLAGLASDGGLYVPDHYPVIEPAEQRSFRDRPYAEVAMRIIRPFVGPSVPADELAGILQATYAAFDHPDVTPLREIGRDEYLLELFHGPTLAFKDIALQLLGRLFGRFLEGRRLTILGATSGDTGSAAIHALAGLGNVEVVMLHPEGRVSEVQRRQMTTVLAPNIHNIAVAGDFDACQRIVKAVLKDPPAGMALGAVNSINWARLMAQVVYYFVAAIRLGAPVRAVAFSVPTGNFGDVFAGYVAMRMGLPVARLIVATNRNDILHRAFAHGDYSKGAVTPTTSPSMDIQVSSNFERLLFDCMDREPQRLRSAMEAFEASGRLALDRAALPDVFASASVSEAEAADTMRSVKTVNGVLIDPHTAVGLAAARRIGAPAGVPMVTLATAHPAKFPDAVRAATGVVPELPARLAHLMVGEESFERRAASVEAITDYLAAMAVAA